MSEEKEIGIVTHYFNKIGVAAIKITEGELKTGDTIRIVGTTSDFAQKVDSMQIDRAAVETAAAGQEIGIKTIEPVRENDKVFLVP